MKSDKLKSAAGGVLAGAANGFFGAGGGTLLVPIFTRWIKMDDQKAYASALAVMLPLCASSAVIYFVKMPPDIITAIPYLIGGLFGGFIGGKVFYKIPPKFLKKAFGLLLIYGGVRSFL